MLLSRFVTSVDVVARMNSGANVIRTGVSRIRRRIGKKRKRISKFKYWKCIFYNSIEKMPEANGGEYKYLI